MNQKGLTLLELLVVVAILGFLAMVGTIGIRQVLTDTQHDVVKNEAQVITSAAELMCFTGCKVGDDFVQDDIEPYYNGQATDIKIEVTENGLRLNFDYQGYSFEGYPHGTEGETAANGGYTIIGGD